jgi:hypothetical protein
MSPKHAFGFVTTLAFGILACSASAYAKEAAFGTSAVGQDAR